MPVKGQLLCLQCGYSAGDTQPKPKPIADLAPRVTPAPAPVIKPELSQPALSRSSQGILEWMQRLSMPRWLLVVVIVVAMLAVADSLTRWYYHDRVYPGVKVGQEDLGGHMLSSLDAKLSGLSQKSSITLVIGQTTYELTANEVGLTTNTRQLKQQVAAAGRDNPLALAGVWQTLTGSALTAGRQVDASLADQAAARIAAAMSHPAVDAAPIMAGITPLVVAEKAGQRVGQAKVREAIILAAGNQQRVSVSASRLAPAVTSASYNADIDDAIAKLNLKLNLKVKTASFAPSVADIAGWLGFGQPGSGARPDAGRVGAYVAGLPGVFDRPAAVAALVTAINARQPLNYTASTKKNIPVTAASSPIAAKRYSYCKAVWGVPAAELDAFTVRSAAALTAAQGWSLGGQLSFVASQSNCNFTLWLVAPAQMTAFSPACAKQSSCEVGNDVVINADSWKAAPGTWKGSLDDYRTELVNHGVGHWLGFDHPSCTPAPGQKEPLSQTTVTVAGCSPRWYEIPSELQGQKVLPGF